MKKEHTKEECEKKIAKWQKRLDKLNEPVYEYKVLYNEGDGYVLSSSYYLSLFDFKAHNLILSASYCKVLKETKRLRINK